MSIKVLIGKCFVWRLKQLWSVECVDPIKLLIVSLAQHTVYAISLN